MHSCICSYAYVYEHCISSRGHAFIRIHVHTWGRRWRVSRQVQGLYVTVAVVHEQKVARGVHFESAGWGTTATYDGMHVKPYVAGALGEGKSIDFKHARHEY